MPENEWDSGSYYTCSKCGAQADIQTGCLTCMMLALSAPAKQCEWSENEDGQWETGCGRMFEFSEAGPEENRPVFCFNCGKPIHPVRWASKEDDASGASGG